MEFFDKLGKKASEAYKITADKTGKLAKEAKLRLKIGDLKSQINDIYEEIGKKVYQNHVDSSTIDLKKEIEESCTKIDMLSEEIEMKLKECLELKDKKQCPNCFTEMDKDMKFCPECGAKQEIFEAEEIGKSEEAEKTEEAEKIEVKEVEIVEKDDSVQSNQKDFDVQDKEEQEEEYKENLQKTVEIEANIDKEDDEETENN